MKIILTFFVLLFSSSVVAEDISDFEIEGMSVGDSLLDYFKEEEILNNQLEFYQDKSFKVSMLSGNFFLTYENILVHYKKNDSQFIIESIDGVISYIDNIDECYLKKNEISKEIKNLFKNQEWQNDQYEDADGLFTSEYIIFSSGASIGIQCYDWNKKIESEYNYVDHLRLGLNSKEFQYWVDNIEDNLVNQ